MAAAAVVSPRISLQDPTPLFVVMMVELLSYRWEMTWKRAAALEGSGR